MRDTVQFSVVALRPAMAPPVFALSPCARMALAVLGVVVAYALSRRRAATDAPPWRAARRARTAAPSAPSGALKLHRLADPNGSGGEVLLLCARTHAHGEVLYQVDTGYAGPPVLSATYLDYLHRHRGRSSGGALAERYRAALQAVASPAAERGQVRATDAYVRDEACFPYTSGCTMRLMGIGSTVEQQAGMFLCSMLEFERADGGGYEAPKRETTRAHADVLVTNPLPNSVHILTADYLFQIAPCCLRMATERLEHHLPHEQLRAERGIAWTPLRLMGGSVVVTLDVGGRAVVVTLDTGAPGGICLGSHAAGTFACNADPPAMLQQQGVNSEAICSTLVSARARLLGHDVPEATVFVNDHPVDHTDGYVGMGFLRAFDLFFTPTHFGCKRSGLEVRRVAEYGATPQRCPAHAAAKAPPLCRG